MELDSLEALDRPQWPGGVRRLVEGLEARAAAEAAALVARERQVGTDVRRLTFLCRDMLHYCWTPQLVVHVWDVRRVSPRM